MLLYLEYPSCPHATLASKLSQPSSHTVPHVSFMQISRRPSNRSAPPTRRSSPWLQNAAKRQYRYAIKATQLNTRNLNLTINNTCHSCIFTMYTVVGSTSLAVREEGFCTHALNIIQENVSNSLSKEGPCTCNGSNC